MGTLIFVAMLIVGAFAAGLWRGLHRERELTRTLVERNEELQAAHTELARLSSLDGLTQLATQQFFLEFLEKEWRRSLREVTPISLIMIDLDHFRAYNNQLGHEAGDNCLKRVAEAVRTAVGWPGDVVARYGGEEFVVVLGRTHSAGAAMLATKLHAAVEALKLPHPASSAGNHVTISLGVATAVPSRGATWQEIELIAAAARALDDAKHNGRNRIEHAEFSPTLVS